MEGGTFFGKISARYCHLNFAGHNAAMAADDSVDLSETVWGHLPFVGEDGNLYSPGRQMLFRNVRPVRPANRIWLAAAAASKLNVPVVGDCIHLRKGDTVPRCGCVVVPTRRLFVKDTAYGYLFAFGPEKPIVVDRVCWTTMIVQHDCDVLIVSLPARANLRGSGARRHTGRSVIATTPRGETVTEATEYGALSLSHNVVPDEAHKEGRSFGLAKM